MRSAFWLAVAAAGAFSGCSMEREKPIATPVFLQTVQQEEIASPLRVSTTDIAGDGRFMRIRGTVENTGSERVEGVRYLVLFLSDGQPPRILDTYQKETDVTLDPGERKGVSLDAESEYNGRTGFNPAAILATPVKQGGKAVPPPPQWK
jgi:hypothetical protein